MTRIEPSQSITDIHNEVRDLVTKFGRKKTLLSLLLFLVRPKGVPPDTTFDLNDHYRKDIGLPPKPNAIARRTPPRQ
ncbi:MAG: hypothetical protein ACRBBQ_14450 [Cognatishimia sp.]